MTFAGRETSPASWGPGCVRPRERRPAPRRRPGVERSRTRTTNRADLRQDKGRAGSSFRLRLSAFGFRPSHGPRHDLLGDGVGSQGPGRAGRFPAYHASESTIPFLNLSLRRRPPRREGPPASFLPPRSGPSPACGNLDHSSTDRPRVRGPWGPARWAGYGEVLTDRDGFGRVLPGTGGVPDGYGSPGGRLPPEFVYIVSVCSSASIRGQPFTRVRSQEVSPLLWKGSVPELPLAREGNRLPRGA